MRKEMISIGITLLALGIAFVVFIFILASRPEGVNGFYFLIPLLLIFTSIIFITQGITTWDTSQGFSVRPYPPYYTPPIPQNLATFCINCKRRIPHDAIICPYCRFKSQETGIMNEKKIDKVPPV